MSEVRPQGRAEIKQLLAKHGLRPQRHLGQQVASQLMHIESQTGVGFGFVQAPGAEESAGGGQRHLGCAAGASHRLLEGCHRFVLATQLEQRETEFLPRIHHTRLFSQELLQCRCGLSKVASREGLDGPTHQR